MTKEMIVKKMRFLSLNLTLSKNMYALIMSATNKIFFQQETF